MNTKLESAKPGLNRRQLLSRALLAVLSPLVFVGMKWKEKVRLVDRMNKGRDVSVHIHPDAVARKTKGSE